MIDPKRVLGVDCIYVGCTRREYLLPEGYTFDDVDYIGIKYDHMWITMNDGTCIEAEAPDGDIINTIDYKRPEVEFDNNCEIDNIEDLHTLVIGN